VGPVHIDWLAGPREVARHRLTTGRGGGDGAAGGLEPASAARGPTDLGHAQEGDRILYRIVDECVPVLLDLGLCLTEEACLPEPAVSRRG
jgi:hypothetical protein